MKISRLGSLSFCWLRALRDDYFAFPAFGFNFGFSRCAKGVSAHRELPGQFPCPKDLDACPTAVSQPRALQGRFVHPRAILETIERLEVHRQVARGMSRIVEPALGNTPNQGHLAAFETDTNRTPRPGRLALAAAPPGFAVAAGFALASSFTRMP